MSGLPENLFANPVWHALQTKHRHFALSNGDSCRYPGDVVPFVAVSAPTTRAMKQVHALLDCGESPWIVTERYLEIPELACEGSLDCLQMVLPEEVNVPDRAMEIGQLSETNAQEMVALTTLAFPGFFRKRTCAMGTYYGVRSPSGELIAMGGERLKLEGFSEISAICTHPAYRGRGLAESIIYQVVRKQRREGVLSWLHVAAANQHAIDLYLRMGFKVVRKITIHRISRKE